jgi:hypothetical protein
MQFTLELASYPYVIVAPAAFVVDTRRPELS